MKLVTDIKIPFPRPLVFSTYRDNLMDVVNSLPNKNDVKLVSHRVEADKVYTVYDWQSDEDIPALIENILKQDKLRWTEYDTWNNQDFTLDWQIKTQAFTEAFQCSGKNTFLEDKNHTLIQTRGEIQLDPNKIDGVPDFLKTQLASLFEQILGSKLEPNLIDMGKGVQKYLEKHK
ncbi:MULTISPECIES: hypothetical protein [Planktothrix]|jgi:hypothetical protein|uniref:Uncharacterized protein n=2 Tax=Planktothrix TaxID=54304 RepID=A0A4P5ZH71_PLAAG|nr:MULTISPECIES: hypothetical protein [Planktothrix]CAD5951631.1 hypothetical protein NO108_02961 [Planktothrix rubescens]CAC5344301.1 conserved hypothetical protein [Planktothrix rubescens NIVA-CYA 18]CAD5914912.1 hypothetical protein PCC7821_00281 [Planktothrix rubescens NIVA-CYA 18]CAD5923004.1 hypothetical protein NO758_00786 [Planktothrix agardhii]CAH2570848.1 hypothetical protein PRNO82_00237 [Planktothrix rubescens]